MKDSANKWSGRWESNPTPNAAKSLILLIDCGRRASNSVQNRGYFLDRFPMRVSHDMTVNLKRGAGVGMAELPLHDFGVGSRIEQERSVSVAECVKAAPWNPERIEDGPQMILHDFVGRRRPVVSSDKEKSLRVWFPLLLIGFQYRRQRRWNGQNGFARLALDGLGFSVPSRAADVEQFIVQVKITPLQAERFGAKSFHRQ